MILVLTTPRTGSTWFCDHLAKTFSIENLDEYFGDQELTLESQVKKLGYIKSNPNVILKCFPWHFKNSRTNFVRANFLEKNLLKLADKIYILIRTDFNSQCKSYYLAKTTNIWSGLPQNHQHIFLDQAVYDYAVNHLKDGYQQLALYNNMFDCEIVEYEKLQFEKNKKYVRPVTWNIEPNSVEFDVKSLFA
jgi:LPS sulfotransferase NodH